MYRKTYVKIDNKTLKNNIIEIKKKYPNYQYYFGIVKNNAYNHGIHVIDSLIAGGINYLAVSSLDEALKIREINKDIPVLILEPISIEYIPLACENNITITLESLDYLQDLLSITITSSLNIHMKIDSGMNRLGFKNKEEVNEAYNILKEHKYLKLEGIYTHFATSGRGDIFYHNQITRLLELISDIDLSKIPIVHFDRSLTFVSHPKLEMANGVRLGIIMYGFNGSIKKDTSLKGKLRILKRKLQHQSICNEYISENDLKLNTAFSLYSEVISLRKVNTSERVGYNASYEVTKPGVIATISVGYADGVTKDFKYVYINNHKYEIVSDSMDMIMVFVDENVKIGDIVEIIGPNISVKEVARRLNTNSYHLFNRITTRVPRVHCQDNKQAEIKY